MGKIKEAYQGYTEAQTKAAEAAGGCIKNPLLILLVLAGIGTASMALADSAIPVEPPVTPASSPYGDEYPPGQLVDQNNIQQPEVSEAESPSEPTENTVIQQEPSAIQNTEMAIDNCQGFPAEVDCRYDSCVIKRSVPLDIKANIFDSNSWVTRRTDTVQEAQEMCAQPIE